jgi:alpha-glucosidase
MEHNYLLFNLNEPNQIEDVSWIKPGKAFREVTQSTDNAFKAIDFSVEQGISYIIFDWGWYGPHNDEANEPSSVNVVNVGTGQPIPGHKGLDLQKVIEYGKSKGVGIFLYVNHQGLERYADVIFPLYQSWGIAGIKPGFVNVGTQGWQIWNEELVKKAAKYKLMVNTHDAFRPTGFSRTYPNFMGQEGIHGNEQNPDATHSTNLPFLRYTIGAGDFTPGYFKKALKTSWAHKLSLPILFYSPVQFLYWIERLDDMEPRPELQLWKNVPTTWDDTKVLSGEIGEHAVVARRKGMDWYVGGITNNNPRTLTLKLDFLKEGKKYEAVIYTDAPDGSKVLIEEKKNLTSKSEFSFLLMPSGGFAMQIKEK